MDIVGVNVIARYDRPRGKANCLPVFEYDFARPDAANGEFVSRRNVGPSRDGLVRSVLD
jgi:hypothetical protein